MRTFRILLFFFRIFEFRKSILECIESKTIGSDFVSKTATVSVL